MNAQDITEALIRERYRRSFVLPHFTPKDWWECDLYELTEAGYFREFEVKISRADFFADAKKYEQVWPRPYGAPPVFLNKHDLLNQKSTRGPVQFFFVTPPDLVRMNEVPDWAGLIEMDGKGPGHRLYERERMKAPRLHNQKPDPAIEKQARSVCYWRMHNALAHVAPLRRTAKDQVRLLREFGWPLKKPVAA